MENWAQATLGDPLFWEYTSNITAEGGTPPDQALVPIEVKRARYNYYFVIRSGDYGVHNAPYAKHLLNVANQNMTAIGARQVAPKAMNKDAMLQLIESDRKRASRVDATMPE